MKGKKNELITQLIRESLNDFLYLTEEDGDDENTPSQKECGYLMGAQGTYKAESPEDFATIAKCKEMYGLLEGEQLSWLDGQGSQEIERRAAEAKAGYHDESERYLPWDDRLEELGVLFAGIALDIIDHYKGRPKFGQEEAKEEILAAIGVPLDIFIGKESEFGSYYSLDTLLDEEFGPNPEEENKEHGEEL